MIFFLKNEKAEFLLEIQLVRPTEASGKVLSVKNGYKSVKTAFLLSNVIYMRTTKTIVYLQTKAIFQPLCGSKNYVWFA